MSHVISTANFGVQSFWGAQRAHKNDLETYSFELNSNPRIELLK